MQSSFEDFFLCASNKMYKDNFSHPYMFLISVGTLLYHRL